MPHTVFISYNHNRVDEAWLVHLTKHLAYLGRQGLLVPWHDGHIKPGTDWLSAIEDRMRAARVAVLLVSPDFLNSEFIQSKEVPVLIERRKADGLYVIPLIVGPCLWQVVPWLTRLEVRPRGGKTLTELPRPRAQKVLEELAKEIIEMIQEQAPPADTAARIAQPSEVALQPPAVAVGAASSTPVIARSDGRVAPRPPRSSRGLESPTSPALSAIVGDFLAGNVDGSELGLKFEHLQVERLMPSSPNSTVALIAAGDARYVVKRTLARLCDEPVLYGLSGRDLQARSAGFRLRMVTPIAVRSEDDSLYELLQFIDGIPLQALIEQNRYTIRGQLLGNLYGAFAKLLPQLSELGIVHRDIRPSNLLLTRRGEAFLIDVTFASRENGSAPRVATQSYSAPEQVGGTPVAKSDWYSLGATLFFLARGYAPNWDRQDEILEGLEDLDIGAYTIGLELLQDVMSAHPDISPLGALIFLLLQPEVADRPAFLPSAHEHSAAAERTIIGVLDSARGEYLVLQPYSWKIVDRRELEDLLGDPRVSMTPSLEKYAQDFLAGRRGWLRRPT